MTDNYRLVYAHTRPILDRQHNLVVRAPCWCDTVLVIESALNDLGERYWYPHTYHDARPDWWIARATKGRPPA